MRQADQILSSRSLKSGFREQWLELVKQLRLSENLWDTWYENSHSVVETGRKSMPLLRKGWEMGSLLGLELGDKGEALEEIGQCVCGKTQEKNPWLVSCGEALGAGRGFEKPGGERAGYLPALAFVWPPQWDKVSLSCFRKVGRYFWTVLSPMSALVWNRNRAGHGTAGCGVEWMKAGAVGSPGGEAADKLG